MTTPGLPMDQQNLKLTYFDAWGRAEITRLTLAFSGVAFEDDRVAHPASRELKVTLPLGQLPVMEVDGMTYCQSMAIARYVGRITDMYPTDALEALQVDEALESTKEVFDKWLDINWRMPEAERAENIKSYAAEGLPQIVGYLEKKVQGKFFLGDKATIADMYLFAVYTHAIKPTFLDFKISTYPKIGAVMANVAANAGVAAYLAKRPGPM